jgi:hypothetical protein
MTAWRYRRLREMLGLPSRDVRVYDLSQFLAEIDIDVLEKLGGDFVMLPLQLLPLDLKRSGWKKYTFWDGQEFLVPRDFFPKKLMNGTLLSGHGHPWNTVRRRMPPGCFYFDRTDLMDSSSLEGGIPHLKPAEWEFPPPFTDEYLKTEEQNARALYQNSEKSIVSSGALGVPAGHSDEIGWGVKMITDPNYALDYMYRESEALSLRMEQYLDAVGKYIDVIVLSCHDFGTQRGEFFNPDLFRDFYVPTWKPLTGLIHNWCDRLKIFIHSCGSVANIIPYFIEAGIDILNPVQWSAEGMERKKLKQDVGDKIIFWGGAVNTQKTFVTGTADEVREEVLESCSILGSGGGYIAACIHNIQSDVPLENVIALFDTLRSFPTPP